MWALWGCLAALAAPVVLPERADPSAWAPALAAAGLDPVAPPTGRWVGLVDGGARWTIEVHDGDRVVQRLSLPAPATAADRADVAALAASLLRPSATVPLAPPPPPRRRRPRAPEVAPPPPVTATAEGVERSVGWRDDPRTSSAGGPRAARPAPPVVPPLPDPPPTVVPAAPAHPLAPWARASLTATGRAGASWTVTPGAFVGVQRGAAAAVVGAEASPTRALLPADAARRWQATDLWAGAWLSPARGPEGALLAGVSIRRWSEAGAPVASHPVALVAIAAGWPIRAGAWQVAPQARLALDVVRTQLSVDGEAAGMLSPLQGQLGVTVARRATGGDSAGVGSFSPAAGTGWGDEP